MWQTFKKMICKPIQNTDETVQAIRETQKQIRAVRSRFDMQSDSDLIEASIYELDALQARYRFLIKQARMQQGGTVCQSD